MTMVMTLNNVTDKVVRNVEFYDLEYAKRYFEYLKLWSSRNTSGKSTIIRKDNRSAELERTASGDLTGDLVFYHDNAEKFLIVTVRKPISNIFNTNKIEKQLTGECMDNEES